MANDAKKNGSKAEMTAKPFDYSKYMPAGLDPAALKKVGGLTPIVPAELLHEHEAVVAGRVVALLDMPPRPSLSKKGEKEDWQAILVEVTSPTVAQRGDDVIQVATGESVVIPVGGSLKNNSDILRAACDPKKVHFAIFRVAGQVDTGRGTPMWDYEVMLHPSTIERTGYYQLHNQDAAPQIGAGA